MANSRKSSKKPTPVTEFPQPAASTAVADVPQEFQEPVEPKTQTAIPPPKNPLKKKTPVLPADGDFFARVAAVPQSDWDSQRVYLYLYVLEPLCNLKQQGGKAYFNRYSSPIRDEHQIAVECGSGRYRLMLAYNRVSAEDSSEMARYEFEIYNRAYPPTVPRAAWINDPRNAKWEALLPKEAPASQAGSLIDAMKVYGEIRRDVRDEIEEAEPAAQSSSTSEVLATMKAARDLFAPATTNIPAAPSDPFDTAAKIMAMRANDPMTAVLQQMLQQANATAEASRDREFKLQEKLFELRNTAPASKTFLEQALELANNADKLEPLKKILGFGNGEATGRVAKTTGMDILNNLVSGPAGTMLAQGLGTLLVNLPRLFTQNEATTPGQVPSQPVVLPGPATPTNNQMPETAEQKLQRIGMTVTEPMLYEFFLRGESGDVWADRMNDLWPADFAFVRSIGPDVLVNHYRQTRAWLLIAPKEKEFYQFMSEFCKWDPNEDEGPVPPNNDDSGIVDLEEGEQQS